MKIAISGNSGFIGRHLTDFFSGRGDIVVPLKHSMFRLRTNEKLKEALSGCDVVINLAGTTINQRWTGRAKRKRTAVCIRHGDWCRSLMRCRSSRNCLYLLPQ